MYPSIHILYSIRRNSIMPVVRALPVFKNTSPRYHKYLRLRGENICVIGIGDTFGGKIVSVAFFPKAGILVSYWYRGDICPSSMVCTCKGDICMSSV